MSVFHRGLQSDFRKNEDCSTAEHFYDLEESQRLYEQLLQENVRLKHQMERSRLYEECCQQTCHQCSEKLPERNSNGDIALWSTLERNRYLENKIEKLKYQYEKQSKTIGSIRSSQKWKNRLQCTPQGGSCYEDKYVQLLRVRSPFY